MQITQKIQNVLDISVKVLKFAWRHALTLAMFGIMICGFCDGRPPIIRNLCIAFAIAACLDWIKMQFKSNSNYNNSQNQMFESARRNMDSSRFGSSAWATNPAMAGSPANHLYSLGYTKY